MFAVECLYCVVDSATGKRELDGNSQLRALAPITHIQQEVHFAVGPRHTFRGHQFFGFTLQLCGQRIQGADIGQRSIRAEGAYKPVFDTGEQQSKCTEYAGCRWHHDMRDTSLQSQRCGMHRPAAAKGKHGEVRGRAADLAGHGLYGAQHGGIGHLMDAVRCRMRSKLQWRRNGGFYRRLCGLAVNCHGPIEQVGAIEKTDHHIGIGHGRRCSATPITGRAGYRTRAFGANPQCATGVYPGQAAAARTDLGQVNGRCTHHVAPTAQQALPGIQRGTHFELIGQAWLAVFNQTCLCGGAAHIKGNDIADTQQTAQCGGANCPGGRAGLDAIRRQLAGRGGFHYTASRLHHHQWRVGASLLQAALQSTKILVDHRFDEGVDNCGAGAFEFPNLGQHLKRR